MTVFSATEVSLLLDEAQRRGSRKRAGSLFPGVDLFYFDVDSQLPVTPQSPMSALHLPNALDVLQIALQYGVPTGFTPEHGGDLVQNLFPVPGQELLQTSSSSKVDLELHTEGCFHPGRASHLVIACLRGNPQAATTFVTAERIAEAIGSQLGEEALRWALHRNVTSGVDESFLSSPGRSSSWRTEPHSILWTSGGHWRVRFDALLTAPINERHAGLMSQIVELVRDLQEDYVLQAGQSVVIDNSRVVHGRRAFTPDWDSDSNRWLLRSFVRPGSRVLGELPLVDETLFD